MEALLFLGCMALMVGATAGWYAYLTRSARRRP